MNASNQLLRKLRIEHVWCLTVIIGVFAFVNTHPIRPNDFWWQLTVGRDIFTTHQVPFTDIYSYTEFGNPYPAYHIYWLMEVCYYWLFLKGGLALIVFSHCLEITLAYILLLWICKQLTQNWRLAAFMTLFAVILGISDWNVRPQAIAFLIGGLFLMGVYEYRRLAHPGWLVVFPLGMVIWINSHGSFPIGFAMIGIWFLDELWNGWSSRKSGRPLIDFRPALVVLATLLVSSLAIFANPLRLGILDYITSMTNNSVIQNLVPEWAPPALTTLEGRIFWVGFGICLLIMGLSVRRLTFFQIATFIFVSGLAIRTSRGIIWFGILMAPVLAPLVNELILRYRPDHPAVILRPRLWLNYTFTSIIILLGIISLPWFKNYLPLPEMKAGLISSETPLAGTNYLVNHRLPTPVFNDLSFGSYLIWAGQPAYQVFVDPRLELYPWDVWKVYLDVSQANKGWEDYLRQYNVQTLFLSPSEQPGLVQAASQSKSWREVYQDAQSVLFIREN